MVSLHGNSRPSISRVSSKKQVLAAFQPMCDFRLPSRMSWEPWRRHAGLEQVRELLRKRWPAERISLRLVTFVSL
jgi:hypothetical protein